MVAREDNATNWLDLTSPGRFLEDINILQFSWEGRLSTRSNQEVWSKAFQTAFPLFAHLEDLDANRVKLSEPESAPESNFFKNFNIPYTTELVFDGNLGELHDEVGAIIPASGDLSVEAMVLDNMLGEWKDYDIYLLRVKGGDIYIGQKLPKIPDDPRASNAEEYKINHWWAELVTVAQRRQSNQNMILFEYRLQSFATDIMNFSIFTGWGSTDVEIYRLRPRQLSTLNYPRGL